MHDASQHAPRQAAREVVQRVSQEVAREAAPSSDVAFSDSVKRVQSRRGSREALRRMGFASRLTPELMEYVSERDSVYLGTASASGQPYIQHRGGPPGFIRRVGETTLGFADDRGNRRYISFGRVPPAFGRANRGSDRAAPRR